MIKVITKWSLLIVLAVFTVTFMSCEQPPTVTTNLDLTTSVVGPYHGNYVVNYEADPQNNFSSQINLVVKRVDKKIIQVDAQGGDSFECTISGTPDNLTISNITNAKGVYTLADEITGVFSNGGLYYKVTGDFNGGAFYAEFTVI